LPGLKKSSAYLPSDSPPPQDAAKLASAGERVRELAESANYQSDSISRCPKALRRVLESGAWRKFEIDYPKGQFSYRENEFDKFAKAKFPAGLGVSDGIAGLVRICEATKGEDSEACLRLIRGLLPAEGPHGTNQHSKESGGNNITSSITETRGTSETYLLRRLKRDFPAIAEQVVSGKLTAHKAARRAGILPQIVQIRPTVEGFTRAAGKYLTDAERMELGIVFTKGRNS
jgi:hypothetical protein